MKVRSIAAAALMATLALSGCGQAEDHEPTATKKVADTKATLTPTPTPEPVVQTTTISRNCRANNPSLTHRIDEFAATYPQYDWTIEETDMGEFERLALPTSQATMAQTTDRFGCWYKASFEQFVVQYNTILPVEQQQVLKDALVAGGAIKTQTVGGSDRFDWGSGGNSISDMNYSQAFIGDVWIVSYGFGVETYIDSAIEAVISQNPHLLQ